MFLYAIKLRKYNKNKVFLCGFLIAVESAKNIKAADAEKLKIKGLRVSIFRCASP
jgi:hypothetical protein